MFKIINKQILTKNIKRLDIVAPNIAERVQPGQFVSVRPGSKEETIPLTVIDTDLSKGSITVIVREVGSTSRVLAGKSINDEVVSILGPLGVPAQIKKKGVVVCIATGIGSAQILPMCRSLRAVGNKVVGIIGAKTKRAVLMEAQMRLACNKLLIATEDGTYERRGMATDILSDLIERDTIHQVNAIGSADMMQSVCKITKRKRIKTYVQLNPVMIDCLGMCGSCRVVVGGKTVLACKDGPEFDGHRVDFENYKIRLQAFEEQKWDNPKAQSSHGKKESKTLTKLFSGILKN